jgi:predicted ATPase
MFTSKLVLVMHISIENLGVVKTAEIELGGITVLAGHNDTGKSFISKIVYSIITTINRAKGYSEDITYQDFYSTVTRIQQTHLRLFPRHTVGLDKMSRVDSIVSEILHHIHNNRFTDKNQIKSFLEELSSTINSDIENFDEAKSRIKKEAVKDTLESISDQIGYLKYLADYSEPDEVSYIQYFKSVIIPNVFGGQINTIGKDSSLSVKVIEGSSILLSLSIKNNEITSFNYLNPIFKTDAILIETPTILLLENFFFNSDRSRSRYFGFPLQYEDLLFKLRVAKDASPGNYFKDISDQIKDIINGTVLFEPQSQTFRFLKDNNSIPSSSIATGIKSLAIIKILNEMGWLTPDTVLVLDEPEVHLHPQWEIFYAKLICELAALGITILLSSHSPYFIRGIVAYSKANKVNEKTKFYFGQKKDSGSFFTDVSSDLEPIFKALAIPMQDIFLNT